jgi:hypothetical protein
MGILFRNGQGYVQVWRSPYPIPTISLERGMNFTLVYMQAHGFRLTELNTNTYFLSGHQAIRVIGIQHFPNGDLKMMMFAIRSGVNLYTVKYLSHPETYLTYLPIAQQIIDSFQVINSN